MQSHKEDLHVVIFNINTIDVYVSLRFVPVNEPCVYVSEPTIPPNVGMSIGVDKYATHAIIGCVRVNGSGQGWGGGQPQACGSGALLGRA